MNNDAVLDRETGLVWEQSPSTTMGFFLDAQFYCNTLSKGNRKGWRVPTIQELATLVDPSVPLPGPTLPAGHPFTNVQPNIYWSATTDASASDGAWMVFFFSGDVGRTTKDNNFPVWCVRGGQGVNPQ